MRVYRCNRLATGACVGFFTKYDVVVRETYIAALCMKCLNGVPNPNPFPERLKTPQKNKKPKHARYSEPFQPMQSKSGKKSRRARAVHTEL